MTVFINFKGCAMNFLPSSKKKLALVMTHVALAVLTGLSANVLAADVDADAAQALAKKSNCLKCHAVDKKKDGPSFKETAGKYKGKADAEEKLFKHLTTNPMIKIDGKEEEHTGAKTKNDADVRNLARWILSR